MNHFKIIIFAFAVLVSCQKQEDYIFNEGPVTISGQIANASGETVHLTILELTGDVDHVTKLDSTGHFQFKVNVLSAHDNFLSYGGDLVTLFSEPNDSIFITADGSNFEKTLTYTGDNASFNQSLRLFFIEFLELLRSEEFFVKKRDLAPNEFKSFASGFFELMDMRIDSIINTTSPEENAIAWMNNYVKYRLAEDLIEYGNHHKEELPSDYYDFEVDFLTTGKYDLQCSQYYEDFIEKYYLGYKLSQAEGFQEMASQYQEQTYEGLEAAIDFIDSNISNGIVKNLSITRFCNGFIEFDYLIVDSIFNKFSTIVTDMTCQNFILQRIDTKKSAVSLVNKLDDLENLDFVGEIFKEIKDDYFGKILYIDVWGTWCGGCISAFPYSNKLFEELGNENIEFIYLCINSAKSNWQKIMMEYDLKGKNYLLTKDQSAILLEKLGFYGVPRYIIIDKNGDIVDENAKNPYSGALKEELQELMYKPDNSTSMEP